MHACYTRAGIKGQEHEEVVVLSKVLAADVNNGYQDLGNIQVRAVNGVRVVNLAHLAALVNAAADAGPPVAAGSGASKTVAASVDKLHQVDYSANNLHVTGDGATAFVSVVNRTVPAGDDQKRQTAGDAYVSFQLEWHKVLVVNAVKAKASHATTLAQNNIPQPGHSFGLLNEPHPAVEPMAVVTPVTPQVSIITPTNIIDNDVSDDGGEGGDRGEQDEAAVAAAMQQRSAACRL